MSVTEGVGPVFREVAAVRHFPGEIGQHFPGEIGQRFPGEIGQRFPDEIGQRFPVALTLGGPRGQRCHVEVE